MSKILLVEDDLFLRTLYVDLLKGAKYDVDFAVDGDEAFNKITSTKWDLILLDVIIPKMKGPEVIERLKKENPKLLKLKIVFLTNLDKQSETPETNTQGYEVILKSDLNPDEFLKKVKSYL